MSESRGIINKYCTCWLYSPYTTLCTTDIYSYHSGKMEPRTQRAKMAVKPTFQGDKSRTFRFENEININYEFVCLGQVPGTSEAHLVTSAGHVLSTPRLHRATRFELPFSAFCTSLTFLSFFLSCFRGFGVVFFSFPSNLPMLS